MEQIKVDELGDRNLWRTGLAPLPVWRRKVKRQDRKLTQDSGKKRKVEESQ